MIQQRHWGLNRNRHACFRLDAGRRLFLPLSSAPDAHLMRGAAQPAADIYFTQAGKRFDQGPTEGCEGHAGATAMILAATFAGKPLDFIPSPNGIWTVARCVDRGGASWPLANTGTSTAAAAEGVHLFGISPMGAPVEGRFSDAASDPGSIAMEPDMTSLEADFMHTSGVIYSITGSIADRKAACVAAKSGGYAVRMDIWANDAYQNWVPGSAPLSAPDRNSPGGGHATVLGGFAADGTGTGIGSWGELWGEDGCWRFDDSYLAAADLYACKWSI